jgi:hypothetical protein
VAVYLPRVRFDHAVRGVDPAAALDALRGGARGATSQMCMTFLVLVDHFVVESFAVRGVRGVSKGHRAAPEP